MLALKTNFSLGQLMYIFDASLVSNLNILRTEWKGNAVKIGNSSRCCEPRPLSGCQAFADRPLFRPPEREGAKAGVSQKTCQWYTILQPAVNRRLINTVL